MTSEFFLFYLVLSYNYGYLFLDFEEALMDKNEKNAALKTEQTPVKGVDKFKTNFGFLMAAVGSAVGLGNI